MRRLLVLVGLVACGGEKRVEYHRVELPGFSVEVPTYLTGDPEAPYREGQIQNKFGFRVMLVSWQLGEPDAGEHLTATVRGVVEQYAEKQAVTLEAPHATKLGGQPANRIDGKFANITFSYVDVACGKRSMLLGASGMRDFPEMRDRLFNSFQCKPIEAEEQQLVRTLRELAGTSPIGVDDPTLLAGWKRSDNDPVVLTLTDGTTIAMFASMAPEDVGDGASIVKQLVAGGVYAKQAAEGTIERGTITIDGTATQAAIATWKCEDRVSVGVTMSGEKADRDAVVAWLGKLRCPRAGEPPLAIAK